MACVINCSSPVRALGIIDALHVIAAHAQNDGPILLGDDYYLRPYAVVDMVSVKKRKRGNGGNDDEDLSCPFETDLVLFKSYKVRTAHEVAAIVLKRMGVSGIHLMEHSKQAVTRRRWRGRALVKRLVFSDEEDECGCEDDGYLKALQAAGVGDLCGGDGWEERRVKIRDEILERFDDDLKAVSRVWYEARENAYFRMAVAEEEEAGVGGLKD